MVQAPSRPAPLNKEDFSTKQWQRLEKLEALLRRPEKGLADRLAAGRLLLELRPRRYGRRAPTMKELSGHLPAKAATLYKCARFARTYEDKKEELPTLAELERLRWDNIATLLDTPAGKLPGLLRKLLKRKRPLTVREVRRRAQRHAGGPRRHGQRDLKVPGGQGGAVSLRELHRLTRRWLAFHDQAWPRGWRSPGPRRKATH